jgi:hypothetical protein
MRGEVGEGLNLSLENTAKEPLEKKPEIPIIVMRRVPIWFSILRSFEGK